MTEVKEKKGWLSRLKDGLKRSSSKLGDGISSIFTKRKLDAQTLQELEDLLIISDLGIATAADLTASLAKSRFNQDITDEEVRTFLAEEVAKILSPVARPIAITAEQKPHVILVVGVNGSGKTTTIGKLAKFWKDEGFKVRLAAGDTFRAAAVEQLITWGNRVGVPVEAGADQCDPASLAFDAFQKAKQQGDDLLLIDTAGRLHNKEDLMAELAKVIRVLQKIDPTAPHDCLLVLDATIGQNAHTQVEVFQNIAAITGLIVTKLDGTAKGGVLVALAKKFALPVHAIGIGEGIDDLRPFEAKSFAESLLAVD